MLENSWQQFVSTGNVNDYLKYKEEEKKSTDEYYNKSTCNKGTDNRGE